MTKRIPDKYQFEVFELLRRLSDAYGAQAGAYADQRKLRERHQKELADLSAAHNVQASEMQKHVLNVDGLVSQLHMQITMLASKIFGAKGKSDAEADD